MSQSLAEPRDAAPIEDFAHAEFSPQPGLTYYVEQTATGVVHHEKCVDAAGEAIYDQGIPIALSVGSGERGRSYLIERGGRLYVSPISWYTKAGRWDFSPGYAVDHNLRFDRKVSEGCMACHAGRVALSEEDHDRFASPPVHEGSIGCERCHGPGREHIAFRNASATGRQEDPIVNPARLTDGRRDAICNQCHLQGRRRVVRSGRSEFTFRPGMFLGDNWVVFLKTAGVSSGTAAAVSQVEQMHASRCYLESRGILGCITCHRGHEVPRGDEADRVYREACVACHSAGKTECSEDRARRVAVTAADSCVVCHMPKFPASDVHAAQTDHRVLRKPRHEPQESGSEQRRRDDEIVLFSEPGAQVDAREWERARGIFLAERAASGGTADQAKRAVDLLAPIVKKLPADVEGRYLLGRAHEKLQQNRRSVQVWKEALEIDPRHEDTLDALAVHYHDLHDLAEARRYYERLIEINPEKSQYYGRLAHVLGQLGDFQRAIISAERCLEINPSLSQSHSWLAEVYRGMGDAERAAIHESKLKQFQSLQKELPRKSPGP
ncbi:MAG: hypothetical protein HY290_16660 [Planctomycetia bacterium]|nr:hypothetical protein [Planctomycetia bacterium]